MFGWLFRKLFGGGMRQAGVIAAPDQPKHGSGDNRQCEKYCRRFAPEIRAVLVGCVPVLVDPRILQRDDGAACGRAGHA